MARIVRSIVPASVRIHPSPGHPGIRLSSLSSASTSPPPHRHQNPSLLLCFSLLCRATLITALPAELDWIGTGFRQSPSNHQSIVLRPISRFSYSRTWAGNPDPQFVPNSNARFQSDQCPGCCSRPRSPTRAESDIPPCTPDWQPGSQFCLLFLCLASLASSHCGSASLPTLPILSC